MTRLTGTAYILRKGAACDAQTTKVRIPVGLTQAHCSAYVDHFTQVQRVCALQLQQQQTEHRNKRQGQLACFLAPSADRLRLVEGTIGDLHDLRHQSWGEYVRWHENHRFSTVSDVGADSL